MDQSASPGTTDVEISFVEARIKAIYSVDERLRTYSMESIYHLYDLEFPLPESKMLEARTKVLRSWNNNLKRPEYQNFKDDWMAETDAERPSVEYRFGYWYREIKQLEMIAKQENWLLTAEEGPLDEECRNKVY